MGDYTPQSRSEEILYDTIHSLEYTERPQSRVEALLLELKEVIEGGGGGGTNDYEELENLPQINSVELTGNKSLMDLGMFKGTHSEWEALSTADKCKYSFTYFTDDYEEGVVVDAVENGNMNPVTSNAVYDCLNDSVSVTKQSSDTTWGDIVKRLDALLDYSRINANSVLVVDGKVLPVSYYNSARITFERVNIRYSSAPGLDADLMTISGNGGYHYSASLNFTTSTWTTYGLNSDIPNSMTIFYR